MIATARRRLSVYAAMAATVPKVFLAYRLWFWVNILLSMISLAVFVFFWRAVYAGNATVGGLSLDTTLHYILLAQIFTPLTDLFLIFEFGWGLREGGLGHVMLRPLDMQASYYTIVLTNTAVELLQRIPTALVATLLFGLVWPVDPRVWVVFLVSALLGRTVMFLFEWILACATFYTTEVWGLSVIVSGVALFFSGALVPLDMMPGWLHSLTLAMPFAQALAVPVSLLSGTAPLTQAPALLLTQAAWLLGLAVVSRLVFNVAVRKVTIQGG